MATTRLDFLGLRRTNSALQFAKRTANDQAGYLTLERIALLKPPAGCRDGKWQLTVKREKDDPHRRVQEGAGSVLPTPTPNKASEAESKQRKHAGLGYAEADVKFMFKK
jgi:hypothetical protein